MQYVAPHLRGTESLDWPPQGTPRCLVGPVDVGKSTILDAIEAVLEPRWLQTSDSDFYQGDTSRPIEVTTTVGELPRSRDTRGSMGVQLCGAVVAGEASRAFHPLVGIVGVRAGGGYRGH